MKKLMFVVVLLSFNDYQEKVRREKGDFFKCTEERYNQIMDYNPNLIKLVPDEADIPNPSGYEADNESIQNDILNNNSNSDFDTAPQSENTEKDVMCDIAQLSDEELLKLAKEKKVRNAAKMSREKLIDALQ